MSDGSILDSAKTPLITSDSISSGAVLASGPVLAFDRQDLSAETITTSSGRLWCGSEMGVSLALSWELIRLILCIFFSDRNL
jgi:hypothetical protein